jgi:ribonuclease P protein component
MILETPSRPSSIKKSADFQRIRKGWRHNGNHLLLQLLPQSPALSPQDQPPPCAFGLIVTRKLGGAVVRNRIKRRLRAAITLLHQQDPLLFASPTWQASLVARKSCVDAPFPELCNDIALGIRRWQSFAKNEGQKRGHTSPTNQDLA